MPTLERIQEEIVALPYDDQIKLSKWFSSMDGKIWDQEIEKDFQAGGPGHKLLEKVKADFIQGKCVQWD
ncbi:hypothetical protein [Desulfonatronum parangueonense]